MVASYEKISVGCGSSYIKIDEGVLNSVHTKFRTPSRNGVLMYLLNIKSNDMYKNALLLFLLCVSVVAQAKETVDITSAIYCYTGGTEKKPVNFEMRTFHSPSVIPVLNSSRLWGGYVRYQNSQEIIPITFKSLVPDVNAEPDSRPPQNIITWVEVYKGKITGEYEVGIQGAIVSYVTYKNLKKHKTYDFGMVNSPDIVTEEGCDWSKIPIN
jgi:hypothetical protein